MNYIVFIAFFSIASLCLLVMSIRGTLLNSKYETKYEEDCAGYMNPDLKPYYRPPGHKPFRAFMGFIACLFISIIILANSGLL